MTRSREGDSQRPRPAPKSALLGAMTGLATIVLLKPAYFTQIPALDESFDAAKMVVAGALLLLVLLQTVRQLRLGVGLAVSVVLLGVYALAAYLAGRPLQDGGEVASVAGLVSLFYLLWPKNKRLLLGALALVLGLLLTVNLVTILLYPEGMFLHYYEDSRNGVANWFLGYKNPLIRIVLPSLAVGLMYDLERKGRLGLTSLWIGTVAAVSLGRVGSSNGLIAIIAFAVLVAFALLRRGRRALGLYTFVIINAVFFLAIVVSRRIAPFTDVLSEVLGKDDTLVGRTYIWDAALSTPGLFSLMGVGSTHLDTSAAGAFGAEVAHPHNLILFLLMKGGLVALALYGILVVRAARSLNEAGEDVRARVLSACLSAMLMIGMTESLTESVLMLPLLAIAGDLAWVEGRSVVRPLGQAVPARTESERLRSRV